LTHADIYQAITTLPSLSVDAVLHDPPRFALAGELYAQAFYDQLARVLKRKGRLFHYTGSPNKISRGRDLASEVIKRLQIAGFQAKKAGDGIVAIRT
jgi:predicted methyltransferase